MKPRTLAIDTPILTLGEEIFHTSALLGSYDFLSEPHTQFEQLVPEWDALLQAEIVMLRERNLAEALIVAADDGIDFLTVAIAASVLADAGGDRKSPIYQRYFGSLPPSRLKRPVLGQQLETMRSWVPSLTASESTPALQAYGQELAARIEQADQAVVALAEVERKEADFEIGERRRFVDRVNGMRMSVYGQLGELAHNAHEYRLSQSFPNRFFLRTDSYRTPTIAEVERRILRHRSRLQREEQRLADLLADKEREDSLRQVAEVQAAEAALAEITAREAAMEAEKAEIAARLSAMRANADANTNTNTNANTNANAESAA